MVTQMNSVQNPYKTSLVWVFNLAMGDRLGCAMSWRVDELLGFSISCGTQKQSVCRLGTMSSSHPGHALSVPVHL